MRATPGPYWLIVLFPFVALLPVALSADPLTPGEACQKARNRAEIIQARRWRMEEATSRRIQSSRFRNPTLSLESGTTRMPTQTGTATGPVAEVRLQQPFTFPGKRSALTGIYEVEEDMAKLQLEAQEEEVCYEALRAYVSFAVTRARMSHDADRLRRLSYMRAYLRNQAFASPQKRAERGIVQNQFLILEQTLQQSRTALEAARQRLEFFVGEPVDQVSHPWFETLPPIEESWVDVCLQGNYDILLLSKQKDRTTAELAWNRKLPYPDLTLDLYARRERPNRENQNDLVGVGITVPIPILDANQSAVRSLEHREKAIQEELAFLLRSTRTRVAELRTKYQGTQAILESYRSSPWKAAQQRLEEADGEFQKGRIDLLSYLQLESQTHDRIYAWYDNQGVAAGILLDLMQLAGQKGRFSEDWHVQSRR